MPMLLVAWGLQAVKNVLLMRFHTHPELVQSGVFLWKLNGTCNCSLQAQTSIKIPWRGCCCIHTFSFDVALISSPLFRTVLKWAQKLKKKSQLPPCAAALGPPGNGTLCLSTRILTPHRIECRRFLKEELAGFLWLIFLPAFQKDDGR